MSDIGILRLEFGHASHGTTSLRYALDRAAFKDSSIWPPGIDDPTPAQVHEWITARGGVLHCEEGPAVLDIDGQGRRYRAWYTNGQLEREQGTPRAAIQPLMAVPGVKTP